jgi:hypothetical protein
MAAPTSNIYSLHYDTAGEVTANTVHMKGFHWTGATNAAHQLTFKDSGGSILLGPYTAGATGAVVHRSFDPPLRCVGLEVDVLGSGLVEVYTA